MQSARSVASRVSFLATLFAAATLGAPLARAQYASSTGQSGLINMPDARVAADGTLRAGLSNTPPYRAGWIGLTILPRVEASLRYTNINGVPGFGPGTQASATYGDYKDKTFDGKMVLLTEDGWVPNVAAGVQDFFGTGIFRATYVAASKRFGPLDLTAGYGKTRLDGFFGGARLRVPGFERFSVVAEYDAYNYRRDVGAGITGVATRKHGLNTALEYRGDSYILQAARQNGTFAYHAYLTVPLEKPDFVPKIAEPEPYTRVTVRPVAAEWQRDPKYVTEVIRELGRQDFRNITVRYADYRMEASLTNVRISEVSRAIGRAARVLVGLSPEETRELRITYTVTALPLATYTFTDVEALRRYFDGMLSREALAGTVRVEFADPPAADMQAAERASEVLDSLGEARTPARLRTGDSGDLFSFRADDNAGNRLWAGPLFQTFLNDPSGAFRFEVAAAGVAERRLAERTFLRAVGTYTAWENVSGVTQRSNSLLPHVRSDIAEYKRASRGKLAQLIVNRFDQPSQRVYTRLSAGIYEQMFTGFGGQVLYMPARGPWAVDFAADAVRQRDYNGLFGMLDYQTVTAIASFHYRMPYDLTGTLRAGRFLAGDEGARVEVKRVFGSGFTVGAWYTRTNGGDITSPGTPANPYQDKGIFMAVPLSPYLTRDTQAAGFFSLSPWTRDGGQMVVSPGDLYSMVERPLFHRDIFKGDGLRRFGEVDDDYPGRVPQTFFNAPHGRLWARDAWTLASNVPTRAFADGLAVAAILTGAAMPVDTLVDRQVKPHAKGRVASGVGDLTALVPLAAGTASAALSVYMDDDRLARTAYSSLRSGVFALGANTLARGMIGRSRPTDGQGAFDFHPVSRDGFKSSMPSNHVATAFAFVTPYAEEYDMPWLYGLAGLTGLGRVAERKHWVSDTIAGSLMGYAVGRAIWSANRDPKRRGPQLAFTGQGVQAHWEFE